MVLTTQTERVVHPDAQGLHASRHLAHLGGLQDSGSESATRHDRRGEPAFND